MGDLKSVPALLARLADEHDLFTRFSLFTALRRIGVADPDAWPVIVAGLESKSDAVRDNTTYALRNTYDAQLIAALVKEAFDKAKPPIARSTALLSAADLHRQPKPWGGNWWGTQPVGSPRPAKVIDWEGTTTILNAIRDLTKDENAEVRSAALRAMRIAPDPANIDLLADLYGKSQDVAQKQLILEALATTKSPKAAELAVKVLQDKQTPAELFPQAVVVVRESGAKGAAPVLIALLEKPENLAVTEPAIDALGGMKSVDAVPAIAKHIDSLDARIWGAGIKALQNINDKTAVAALVARLADKRPDVRKESVIALGQMKARDAVPAIVEALQKRMLPTTEGVKALTQVPDVRALSVYLDSLGDRNQGKARDAQSAIAKIKVEARPEIEKMAEAGKLKDAWIAPLQEIFGSYTPVAQWQVLGPYAGDKADPLPPGQITKGEGEIKTADGAQLAWKKVKGDKEGMVDLGKEIGGSGETVALLFAEIQSKTDREVSMEFGSDDCHTVWLNGEKIADDTGHSGWKADEQTVKAKLKSGKNLLVVRCGNFGGGWQFSGAVAAERSGKLFEIKPTPAVAAQPKREEYEKFAMTHPGAADRGKVIFNGQAASCIKCHQVSPTEGGLIGPSLLGVGAKYDRAKLIESVLYPSKQIFDGFQQSIIRTNDGDVVAGVIKSESEQEITLYDSAAQKIVLKKSDVKSRKISEISAMPEGLEQAMSKEEFADLVSYLQSLKEGGAPPPKTK